MGKNEGKKEPPRELKSKQKKNSQDDRCVATSLDKALVLWASVLCKKLTHYEAGKLTRMAAGGCPLGGNSECPGSCCRAACVWPCSASASPRSCWERRHDAHQVNLPEGPCQVLPRSRHVDSFLLSVFIGEHRQAEGLRVLSQSIYL